MTEWKGQSLSSGDYEVTVAAVCSSDKLSFSETLSLQMHKSLKKAISEVLLII